MHTVVSNFSNFVMEYLGEIETEFDNTLACFSGAQIGSTHGLKIEIFYWVFFLGTITQY